MAARWQPRLEQLAREFEVPGASLAVWHRGTLETAACGVVNLDTGVAEPYPPKSSSRMFSGSTPRSSSIFRTAAIIGGGPHR
jgi:CubicO group peptidase (beta-lactamase class C family)